MVQLDYISKSVYDAIVKCSNQEISSKLSGMSQEEKDGKLDGKLNPAEKDHYDYLIGRRNDLENVIREHEKERERYNSQGADDMVNMIDGLVKNFRNELNTYDKSIFGYEKRIVRGHKLNDGKDVNYDLKKYSEDNDTLSVSDNPMNVRLGDIENKQINLQQNIGLDSNNYDALMEYFGSGSSLINSRLNNGREWNSYSDSHKKDLNPVLNESEKYLSDAIGKTKGLSQNTLLYHRGSFDVSKVVGDHLKFKGYTSTSFQKGVADDWTNEFHKGSPMYTYRFLTPSGTKGICANDNKNSILTHHREEHEYLLDKGVEGDIVDIDVKNHIVTLQL